MKKTRLVVGALAGIVFIFWLVYILILLAGDRLAVPEAKQIQDDRSRETVKMEKQPVVPVVVDSEVAVYKDAKYSFSFDIPKNFVQEKTNDGMFAYTLYFTSKVINGDYNKLLKGDVQLSVQVSKEKGDKDAVTKAIQGFRDAQMTVTTQDTATTIAGESAEIVQVTSKGGSECSARAYFMRGNVNYEIVLTSPDACEGVIAFSGIFKRVLSSFQFEK
jgi:hypothetical protein